MEKRIALEKRGSAEEEVTELNLDNCKSTSIDGLTDKFVSLETLSLINVGLTSLKNFPALPNLRRLELSDNRLFGGLTNITNCPNLQTLNLSGNRIKDLEEIRPLAALPKLEILDLFNNEITQIESYREKMFEILGKTLKYLDGFNKSMVEAPSDSDDEENGNGSEDEYDENDSDEGENNDLSLAEVSLPSLLYTHAHTHTHSHLLRVYEYKRAMHVCVCNALHFMVLMRCQKIFLH